MSRLTRTKKPGPIKPTPNPYPSRFQKWRKSLGFSFVLILVLGFFFRVYSPYYKVLEEELFEAIAWAQLAFIQPFQDTQALLTDTHRVFSLKEKYTALQAENQKLKQQLQKLAPLNHENKKLRGLLKVPASPEQVLVTARVLSSPYDGLHHFFLIEAGNTDGIKKNQAVFAPQGLVGRIEKVGRNLTRVLLLNDPNSRIPVRTLNSDQKAILVGDGNFLPNLVYVGDSRKIEEGEPIVTSGLGGYFPQGLAVGVIDKIGKEKITVRPYVPFRKIEWVQILASDYGDEIQKDLFSGEEE